MSVAPTSRTGSKTRREDLDFLPAALEILETPASPVGRIIIWLIVLFFLLALGWSIVSKVDVVAVANGKIIPSGKVKTVQAFESGIVRAIHVSDGQRVEQGELLIELDSVVSEAEVNSIRQQVERLEETLPLVTRKANGLKELAQKDLIPRNDYVQAEEQRISVAQELKALRHEQKKAMERTRWQKLTAPVSGVVQQLAVHTLGGVVTSAEPLMVIVPEKERLEVEAFIANKDIGFVLPGHKVQIKVETFPFTKYGLIEGELINVSDDAVEDEKLGLVYAAKVAMHKSTINVDGRMVNLTPGMSMTVEIQTGKRRIIEYFLSPLLSHGRESIRER